MDSPSLDQRPAVAVRNWRERAIQTLWFEGLGLLIVAPLLAHFAGTTVVDSLLLLLLLSAVVTLWAALYNTVFDVVEHRIAHRAASSRPQRWRVVHALGLEISAVALTWPLLMLLTPLGWQAAFVAEIGLTLAYAAYGYVFHLAFDRLRPVCENSRRPS